MTDGWSAYATLNNLSGYYYKHFVVNFSRSFTKEYANFLTGETLTSHTNKIEGAWAHLKKVFLKQRMAVVWQH